MENWRGCRKHWINADEVLDQCFLVCSFKYTWKALFAYGWWGDLHSSWHL